MECHRGGNTLPPRTAAVKTYRDVLSTYRVHPEPKSLNLDGRPCRRSTIGLLQRRPVQALSITHIGKETNLLDEIQAGLIGNQEQVLTEYHDQQLDPFVRLVVPVLRELPIARRQLTWVAVREHRLQGRLRRDGWAHGGPA